MKRLGFLLVIFMLLGCGAQQDTPYLVQFPTSTPQPPASPTPISSPTATPEAASAPAIDPTPTFVVPQLTPFPDDDVFRIGFSVEDRPIEAWQFGEGPTTIVLVGGIHGGYEGNTVVLSEMMIEHFRENPADVLPGLRLVIIPNANPDGLTRGSSLQGRFNARGVDLNRNWGCDWEEEAFLRDIPVSPGPRPFSEPESVALREYFVAEPPAVVLFYHSALGAIFLGECADSGSEVWLGELLEDSTGYDYQDSFDFYEVTGDATNWLAERGIPAAVIELETRNLPEFQRNLAGVMALQCLYTSTSTDDPDVLRLCR